LPAALRPGEQILVRASERYAAFEQIKGPRCARGKRYRLSWLFILTLLAKLAGAHTPNAITCWARLRWAELQVHADSTAPHAPSAQTFRRMWTVLIDGAIFEQ
jgi:hypothetical protein